MFRASLAWFYEETFRWGQISCSCDDGLIRPPFQQVGQPEVHGAGFAFPGILIGLPY